MRFPKSCGACSASEACWLRCCSWRYRAQGPPWAGNSCEIVPDAPIVRMLATTVRPRPRPALHRDANFRPIRRREQPNMASRAVAGEAKGSPGRAGGGWRGRGRSVLRASRCPTIRTLLVVRATQLAPPLWATVREASRLILWVAEKNSPHTQKIIWHSRNHSSSTLLCRRKLMPRTGPFGLRS